MNFMYISARWRSSLLSSLPSAARTLLCFSRTKYSASLRALALVSEGACSAQRRVRPPAPLRLAGETASEAAAGGQGSQSVRYRFCGMCSKLMICGTAPLASHLASNSPRRDPSTTRTSTDAPFTCFF